MKPILLGPNQPPQFYRGGAAIARFRGLSPTGDRVPEDWIASTTSRFGNPDHGATTLSDGRLLRDAVAADPRPFLGPAHIARFGADPGLLVKLLDVGEHLPVHAHPDRGFARVHLGSRYGKSEAWFVIEAEEGAHVHVGFREDVDRAVLADWAAREDADAMLAALHRVEVAPGDCVYVPAGTPHAIGADVLLLEVQEPSDFGVLLEWSRFGLDVRDASMGLAFEEALECVRRTAVGEDELASWGGFALPEASRSFFRAEWLRPQPSLAIERCYSVLVVIEGTGRLETEAGVVELARGCTLLVPYDAGESELTGRLTAIRCAPPRP